jgi:integrase/recombinase XerD
MTSLRQRMLEDLRIRNYAPTTVECCIRSVAEFAQHFHKPPDQLGPEEIRTWQLFLLREKRLRGGIAPIPSPAS